MIEGLAIAALAAFVLATAIYLSRRNGIVAFYYVVLYVYTFFTQVAYVYYPDMAVARRIYYGLAAFWPYWTFVSLSFVAVFGVLWLMLRRGVFEHATARVPKLEGGRGRPWVVVGIVGLYEIVMVAATFAFYDDIGYRGDIFPNRYVGYGFFLLTPSALVLYSVLRSRPERTRVRVAYAILLAVALALLLLLSYRAGQRNQLAVAAIGLTTYELLGLRSQSRPQLRRRLVALSAAVAVLFVCILAVSSIRLSSSQPSLSALDDWARDAASIDFSEMPRAVVDQDYLPPSLMLMVSIENDLIIPGKVLASNAHNALVLRNYPTLAQEVGGVVNPTVTRNQGYAYYALTEGYNFAGWAGPIYNALIIPLGLWAWHHFLGGSAAYSRFVTALVAMQVFVIVRGQSVYFVRTAYLILIPAIVLYMLATGMRVGRRAQKEATS